MSTIDWESVESEMRRIMLVCPETWNRGYMDDATVRTVWEEELDQSEKDYIVKHYRAWGHRFEWPIAIVRWRAAVGPFIRKASKE